MAHSLRAFARMAGVSPATVSRIFSGRGKVAPETAQRVRELADRVGFRPSAIGRVAFGGTTRSVGVQLPSLQVGYFAAIATGIQRRLLAADHLPVVLQHGTGEVGIDERRELRRLLDHRVDGLIIHPVDETIATTDFRTVLRLDLPLVLIGAVAAGVPADRVDTDDVQGARAAAEHLLALGHRRIGFCAFGAGQSNSDLRRRGLVEALAAHGLALRQEDIAHLPTGAAGDQGPPLRDQVRAMLARPDRPTAILAGNDLLALQVYAAARDLGLRLPADLSVVGFADLAFAAHVEPPLTTVRQPGEAVGEAAADLVLRRLAEPGRPLESLTVPTALVARGSTAPPRA